MSPALPREERDAIRARVDRATEGPWGHRAHTHGLPSDGPTHVCVFDPEDVPVAELDYSSWGERDAEFIAHARTDVPALLDALDAAEAKDIRRADAIRDALAELRRAEAERDAARAEVERLRAVSAARPYETERELVVAYDEATAMRVTAEAERDAARAETEQYRRNEVTLTGELSRARQDAAEFCGQRDEARAALAALEAQVAAGEASDGHHTHRELYDYRMLYNAHAARGWIAAGIPVVKSWHHSDGEPCFGGGWFIVVATLPTGQVSNHYRAEHWDLFDVPEVALSPDYDGHTPADAADRLRAALASRPAPTVNAADVERDESLRELATGEWTIRKSTVADEGRADA